MKTPLRSKTWFECTLLWAKSCCEKNKLVWLCFGDQALQGLRENEWVRRQHSTAAQHRIQFSVSIFVPYLDRNIIRTI